jgi:osmotically inducible protein OsmC
LNYLQLKYKMMKFTRKASANWKGPGKTGKGTLTTESAILDSTPYSFSTRFEEEAGTNPEELVGAAHAGCFTMQLSFLIGETGFTPENLETAADVTFEDGSITHIHLTLTGHVPGMDKAQFTEVAEKAKEICPISKLLDTEITLDVSLES